jgi:signal peptidase I
MTGPTFHVGDRVHLVHTNESYRRRVFEVRLAEPDRRGQIVLSDDGSYVVHPEWNLTMHEHASGVHQG